LRIGSVKQKRLVFLSPSLFMSGLRTRSGGKRAKEGYLSRLELIRRLKGAEGELKQLRSENRLLHKLVENLDKELKRYRAKPFLDDAYVGVRQFDKNLIELLRGGGILSDEEILSSLNIDPADTDFVKAASKQIEALEAYGLVEFTGKGWRRKG